MSTIKAILSINSESSAIGSLTSIVSNQTLVNVSKNAHKNYINVDRFNLTDMEKNSGHLGVPYNMAVYPSSGTMIGDGNYNGYMWGLTNSNKEYSLKLDITGTDLFSFKFYFDDTAQQYPTHYIVKYLDGTIEEFTNDTNTSSSVTIMFQGGTGTQSVTFDKWTKANYNVAITYIEAIPAEIIMNKKWIKSMSTTSEKTSNPSEINYGCISNTGSIELYDIKESNDGSNKGTLFTYSQNGYLSSDTFALKLFLNDKQLQIHIPSDNPYYNDNNTFDISLSNKLDNWNNIIVDERTYSGNVLLIQVLYDIFNDGLGLTTAEVDAMLKKNINVSTPYEVPNVHREMTVLNYVKSIKVRPFTLKKGTLVEQINKICTVTQLQAYFNDEGNFVFTNARPLACDDEVDETTGTPIVIPFRKQFGGIKTVVLVSNRYDDVNFS